CLVLFGKGENSIFEIDQELKQLGHSMVVPFVGDVRDPQAVANAFERFKPSVVFHAAAHKHVPMMEAVPIEAIRNNVVGTMNMADAALRQGCNKFILVSTDKAVNPTNVMGATKRVAEMIVGAYAGRGETDFAAVRFGNVLGSRGSLIPILTKQIEQGGPITITHPEMTRFFMTIPEAAQLILQAGSLGSRGDIFILDMGEPVRIMDIASDLVRLNGLEPGRDIEIKIVGIRPGEKMHEELSWSAEDVTDAGVNKVMRVVAKSHIGWQWLKPQIDELDRVCRLNDSEKARALLLDLAWGNTLPPSSGQQSESVLVQGE
ncbi:MAG: polysaccharide biosynthesis protein, partial [Armatimonadota bacterium]